MVQYGSASGQAEHRGFSAFISYSHADAAIAAKLQKRLERYRLPRSLLSSYGLKDQALGKIFRDREDLAAAPSLSDAIRAALSQSQSLIVICSPDAARSKWVSEEIALFGSLHPSKPILAVLVRGEPADAFPALITAGGAEPLAADLRKGADGQQLGLLKIVAGIAGVPLDALIQRDAQRKLRRVTAITLGALVAMLIMAVMTSLAISARNEAAQQRAESEGLVEYMLTDLREKLKGVGRLDVMGAVNRRAMTYYGQQGNLAALPADSLERRARVLHAMGEDDEKKGDFGSALSKFREAHRTTEALLKQDPKNPDRIFAHAQSEFYVGLIAWRQSDRATTAQYWQGYAAQAEALAKIEPGGSRSLMELGFARGNLCELNSADNHDLKLAETQCLSSVQAMAAALTKSPANPKIMESLANRYGWLAGVQGDLGKADAALDSRAAEAALMTALRAADPGNIEYALRSSWSDLGVAQIEFGRKDYAAAMRHYDSANKVVIAALKNAPDHPELWETRLRVAYLRAKCAREAHLARAKPDVADAVAISASVTTRFGKNAAKWKRLQDAIETLSRENDHD